MALNDSNVIENLTELGLTPREAKLYFALLKTPEATPADLCQLSSVPRTRIYEVLGKMVACGFCIERREGTRRFYRATKPSELRAQLRNNWKAEDHEWEQERRRKFKKEQNELEKNILARKKQYREQCKKAKNVLTRLDDVFQHAMETDPVLDKVEIIRSSQQLGIRVFQLFKETEDELLSFARSPYVWGDAETRAKTLEVHKQAFSRGLSIRTVYLDESHTFDWFREEIVKMEAAGEDVRVAKVLPVKMFLFDRKTCIVSLPSVAGITGSDFISLVVEDPGYVEANIALFETYWSKGTTLDKWLAAKP